MRCARLPLRVQEPGGHRYGGGSSADPEMRLVRPHTFFHRLGASGTIGFGEAYMAGDWTTEDLAGVLSAFAANMRDLVPEILAKLRHAVLSRQPFDHDNTKDGARQNIQHHYDLSNDLFEAFLDETMTYSSALFDGEPYGSDDGSRTRSGARSTGCSTSPASARAPGCSRSDRAGVSSRSARRSAARTSPR